MKWTKLLHRIKCEIMYRKAVSLADKTSAKNGKVYFVMPTETGKLMVISYEEYCAFRKAKLTPRDLRPRDMFRESLYHTNCKSKKGKQYKKHKFLRWQGL